MKTLKLSTVLFIRIALAALTLAALTACKPNPPAAADIKELVTAGAETLANIATITNVTPTTIDTTKVEGETIFMCNFAYDAVPKIDKDRESLVLTMNHSSELMDMIETLKVFNLGDYTHGQKIHRSGTLKLKRAPKGTDGFKGWVQA